MTAFHDNDGVHSTTDHCIILHTTAALVVPLSGDCVDGVLQMPTSAYGFRHERVPEQRQNAGANERSFGSLSPRSPTGNASSWHLRCRVCILYCAYTDSAGDECRKKLYTHAAGTRRARRNGV